MLSLVQSEYIPMVIDLVELTMTQQMTKTLPPMWNHFPYAIDMYLLPFVETMEKQYNFVCDLEVNKPI